MVRVLIVDDEPLVRQGLRMLLTTVAGLEISGEATDGDEAVRQAAYLRPDLVIMDARMPGRDGFSAIADIKRMAPEALIILISMEGGDDFRLKAGAAGAFAFAEKGGEGAGLLREVQRAIVQITSARA